MSANTAGTGRKLFTFIGILFFTALAGFVIYEYTTIFKKSQTVGDDMSGAHKIDKNALIANLEKKIKGIPADNAAANLDGYRRLLKLAPGNIRYKQKVDYYNAQQKKSAAAQKPRTRITGYIKVGYPAPRVLDHPGNGQMVGRVESGSLVEVLDSTVLATGSLPTVWYQIRFGKQTGWLSKLGTTGSIITHSATPDTAAKTGKEPGDQMSPWEKLATSMIDDYGGKIISIDRLDITESHFSLYNGMTPEQVRQTCENIGYYIRNSIGVSPVVVAFIERIPVARAEPVGTKYQAKLITK
ncbi:MAG: hypothetical protein GY697_26650 [Desulfobacterales bacterium]|nr:hypothetical protein [Desulfobacterales bacterium]